jgi:hypothetical protein
VGCLLALGCSSGASVDEVGEQAELSEAPSREKFDAPRKEPIRARLKGARSKDKTLEGPLAELPAEAKRSDFRLTPPRVTEVTASAARDGTTDVTLVLEADPRLDGRKQLTLPLDQGKLVLTAAGDGQLKDGSRAFTTNVAMPFKEVLASQQRAQEVAAKLGDQEISVFRGREIVATRQRPFFPGDASKIPLPPPPPSMVDSERSLLVRDSSVVNDGTRTFDPCTGAGTPLGPWTFGKLMSDMAGSVPPGDFVEAWLSTFLAARTINTFDVAAQSAIAFPPVSLVDVLATWPRLSDGTLDVAQAPFKLVAIVNRADLAGNSAYGPVSGAEGRFVFTLVKSIMGECRPIPFSVIFEFGVPKSTCSELQSWAQQWLSLSTLPLGTAAYNSALQALTDEFATAGADPSKPNDSALDQLRTNAFVGFAGPAEEKWELRQFHLLPGRGSGPLLRPVTVSQTPDMIYDGVRTPLESAPGPRAAQLAAWVTDNVTGTPNPFDAPSYTVPLTLPCPLGTSGLPCADMAFRAGATFSFDSAFWSVPWPSALPNSAMNVLSLNTCNGCHAHETGTLFTHVDRAGGLSGFLRGITVTDPRDHSVSHTYSDLLRRKGVLQNLAGAFCGRVPKVPKQLETLVFPSPLPPVEMTPILAVH